MHKRVAGSRQRESLEINYKGILNSVEEGIFALDERGVCIYCNPASRRILGYKKEEDFLGKRLHSILHFAHPDGSSYPESECKILQAILTGKYESVNSEVFWNADGAPVPVTYSCFPQTKNGRIAGSVISFSDLSNQKLQQKKLEASEAKYRNIFKNANAGIIYVNESGYTVSANLFFQTLLLYSLKELQELHYSEFTVKEDFEKEVLLRKELHEGKRDEYKIEKRYIRKDGNIIWVSSGVSAFREQPASPLSYVAVIHDISDRKDFERKLTESNATKDKFFSIIAHDLRNPVGSLKTISELLNRDLRAGDMNGAAEMAGLLGKQITNTLELLNDLLEWSGAQAEKITFSPVPLRVKDVFEERAAYHQVQAGNKQLTIKFTADESLMVYADLHMLNTILRNLITNAIKFSYENGLIWLDAEKETDEMISISVQDQGTGIPPPVQEKLFLPGTKYSTPGTWSENGTGLGLMLCKEFVGKHGGEIRIKSAEGAGSRITFTLPVSKSNPGEREIF